MDTGVGIIPLPIYCVLFAVLGILFAIDAFSSEISLIFALLAVLGFSCAELGARIARLAENWRGGHRHHFAAVMPGALLAPAKQIGAVHYRILVCDQYSLFVYRGRYCRRYSEHGPAPVD